MNNSIFLLRRNIETEHFTDAAAAAILGDRPRPDVVLARLTRTGNLLRLRRGLYLFGAELRRRPVSLFSIANLLYGPSYVSCESALSHYGLIPEAVHTTISVNSRRSRTFTTPLGVFLYRKIPPRAFAFGIQRITASPESERNGTLIASREKALIDLIYLTKPRGDLVQFASESLRIDRVALLRFQTRTMRRLAATYGQPDFTNKIALLARAIERERKTYGR